MSYSKFLHPEYSGNEDEMGDQINTDLLPATTAIKPLTSMQAVSFSDLIFDRQNS